MSLELIPILKDGSAPGIDVAASPDLAQIIHEIVSNYDRAGYEEPWAAYVAVHEAVVVGTCAFKTPPKDGVVEIAYFTFPKFENHGYATQMAQCLVQIAQDTDDTLKIIARTLPIAGPSASVLTKCGFVKTGEVLHPEDGLVWEWEYRKAG